MSRGPDETPRPMGSPMPDYAPELPDEPPSGSHLIPAMMNDVKEAKKNVEAVVEARAAQQTTYIFSSDVKWFVGSIASVIVGVVMAISWMDARGQTQLDAGIAPLRVELRDEKKAAELVQLGNESRFSRLEASMQRQDLKSDAILMGLHLSNPAPTPKDAGQ